MSTLTKCEVAREWESFRTYKILEGFRWCDICEFCDVCSQSTEEANLVRFV